MATTKILLICEEIILARAIQFVLQKNNWEVSVCYDGHSGFEKLKTEHFDYLITEILLPFFSGFDLVHHFIKTHHCDNVLILSVFDNPGLMERSLNFRQVKRLHKPYDLQEINHLVKEQLNNCVHKPTES